MTASSNSGVPGFMPGGAMAGSIWSSGIWKISGAATGFVMNWGFSVGGARLRAFICAKFNIPDEGAFVAVVNHTSGEVITVYPALREDLSKLILTDHDPVARVVHTAYVNSRTTRLAMRLAGLTPPKLTTPRLFSRVFVARYLTREGQPKTKIIGRVSEGADIEDALEGAIAKAVELSEKNGTLGMMIDLRKRDDINVIQEWVLEEAVSYGVGDERWAQAGGKNSYMFTSTKPRKTSWNQVHRAEVSAMDVSAVRSPSLSRHVQSAIIQASVSALQGSRPPA